MAVSTLTASTYLLEPRAAHVGTNHVVGTYVYAGGTISDVVFLARVPNQATITDIWVRGNTAAAAAAFRLGITGNGAVDTFAGASTISTAALVTHRPGDGLGFKVSLSTTDTIIAQTGATVYLTTNVGSWSTTATLDFGIAWVMDGAGR